MVYSVRQSSWQFLLALRYSFGRAKAEIDDGPVRRIVFYGNVQFRWRVVRQADENQLRKNETKSKPYIACHDCRSFHRAASSLSGRTCHSGVPICPRQLLAVFDLGPGRLAKTNSTARLPRARPGSDKQRAGAAANRLWTSAGPPAAATFGTRAHLTKLGPPNGVRSGPVARVRFSMACRRDD